MADMEHYLIPIIQEKPGKVISHVETNDAKNLPSQTVSRKHTLKVENSSLPTCRASYIRHYALMMVKHK